MVIDEASGQGPVPALDLVASDTVLVLVAGPDGAAFEQRAGAAGATVVTGDLVAAGPDGVGDLASEAGATVVVLPGLVGRWMSAAASAVTSVRLVVLVGSRLDDRSVAGVRTLLPSASLATWVPEGRAPGAWEDPAAGEVDDPTGSPSRAGRVGLGEPVRGRDDLERSVMAVFETVTGVAPVGRTDRLADLGIDRDRAAWFVDEAAWRFGVALRAGELIDHPSVDAVIALIRNGQGHDRRRPVTAVLPSAVTAAPGLLLLHGLDGSPYPLLPLAADLPVKVIGFESPLLDGRPSPFDQLELMALRYLADVRRVQPDGPYRLAGRGFGGALAYEMARQLLDEGAEVTALVVADCGPGARLPTEARSISAVGARIVGALARPSARSGERAPLGERPARAAAEHDRLLRAYRWPAPKGAVLPVTVAWSSHLGSDDASLGWDGLVGRGSVTIERLAPIDPTDGPDGPGDGWAEVLGEAVGRPATSGRW